MHRVADYTYFIFLFFLPLAGFTLLGALNSIANVLGMLTGAIILLNILLETRIRMHYANLLFFILFAWGLFTVGWNGDTVASVQSAFRLMELAACFWMTYYILKNENCVDRAVLWFLSGAFVLVLLVSYITITASDLATHSGRLEIRVYNANTTGFIIGFAFISSIYLSFKYKIKTYTLIFFLLSAFFLASLIWTGTRSSFLALGFSGIFVSVWYVLTLNIKAQRFRLRTWIFFTFCVSVLTISTFVFQEQWGRILEPFQAIINGQLNLTGRKDIWQAGIQILGNNPIKGYGVGQFERLVDDHVQDVRARAPHNEFLGIWVELGVLGLVLFLIVLGGIFLEITRCRYKQKKIFLYALFVFIVTMFFVTNIAGNTISWFALGLILALARCYRTSAGLGGIVKPHGIMNQPRHSV